MSAPSSSDSDASTDADVSTGAVPPSSPEAKARRPAAAKVNSAPDAASNKLARRQEAAEDRALIEQAQKGDRAAFRRLVERHQRRAFSIAFGLVRDEQDAREIVQEAFLRVHRGLDGFEGTSSFFTWLYRIVTNLAIDLVRKPGRRTTELDEARLAKNELEGVAPPLLAVVDGADPLDVLRRKEIAGRIREAVDALPPYHRDAIVLREIEGLSYEEMAEAMGVSKGTVMSRLFHARQKLQRALADVYAEHVRRPDPEPPSASTPSSPNTEEDAS